MTRQQKDEVYEYCKNRSKRQLRYANKKKDKYKSDRYDKLELKIHKIKKEVKI